MTRKTLKKQISAEVASACACRKMREASRKVTRIYEEALRPTGIKATQFTVLAVVTCRDEATLTELAETLGMDRTTLSRNLRPIEREGLIEISPEGYRRARTVNITSKGVAAMEQALPLWRSAQKRLRKRLGDNIWNRIQKEITQVGRLL